MITSMEVSLYPLGEAGIGPIIDEFIGVLQEFNLTVTMGQMSTIITGDSGKVFTALEKAYTMVAEKYGIVIVCKISNACPV
jgi:uncharacterized protein YqgV (UPF0045/DUF77 family)